MLSHLLQLMYVFKNNSRAYTNFGILALDDVIYRIMPHAWMII